MIDRIKSASIFVMTEMSYINCNYKRLIDSYSDVQQPSKTEVMAKDMLRLNWECNEKLKEIERLRKKIKDNKQYYIASYIFVIAFTIGINGLIITLLCGK